MIETLFMLWLILTVSNFVYQPLFESEPDYLKAFERSLFQGVALGLVYLNWSMERESLCGF